MTCNRFCGVDKLDLGVLKFSQKLASDENPAAFFKEKMQERYYRDQGLARRAEEFFRESSSNGQASAGDTLEIKKELAKTFWIDPQTGKVYRRRDVSSDPLFKAKGKAIGIAVRTPQSRGVKHG